jgi:K+-sensing histidine kinase KdpD
MIGRTRPGRSLRLRLTGLAALAMAVTIALGTLVMAFTLARSVRANVDTTLNTYAGLLDNADRHAESRVHLRVSPEPPGTALLQVADDGPGIPPADRERVFDRFVRLDSARTRPKGPGTGTGLGLSLARDIVTAHGGTITVTGLPAGGPGAAFEVRLPACGEPPGGR